MSKSIITVTDGIILILFLFAGFSAGFYGNELLNNPQKHIQVCQVQGVLDQYLFDVQQNTLKYHGRQYINKDTMEVMFGYIEPVPYCQECPGETGK